MPPGSKKRKASKKPKPDDESTNSESIEIESGLEEGMDNDGEEMGEGSLSPKTPVRDAEAMAEGGVVEEEINGENVQEGEMDEGFLSPKTPAWGNGIQLEDASAPRVVDLETTVHSPDQQEDGEADPVQAEPEEDAPVGIEPEADAAPVEIKPEADAAPVEIEPEVEPPVEIEPEVDAPVEIEPEQEVEALAEAQPDEQALVEAEADQQDLVEIEPDQPALVEIQPDQQVADGVGASESGGDLHVGSNAGEELNAVWQQDDKGGAELGELDTSISEVDQASEPQEQIADVLAEPPVVEEELDEQADRETPSQDLPDELPDVSVSDEAILIEESSLSIQVPETSIDANDEGHSHEQENWETTEESENLSTPAVEGTVEGDSDEQELDTDELERENAGNDGQGAVDRVLNGLGVDDNEQERAADDGYGEDEAVSASAEDASEVILELDTKLPSANEQGASFELNEEDLGTGLPPANDQELGTERPPVDQQELSIELHAVDEQDLGIELPPAVEQEMVEQDLDTEGATIEEEFDLDPREQEIDVGEDEATSSTVAEVGSVLNDLDEALVEIVPDEQELDSGLASAEQEIGVSDSRELDDALSPEGSHLVELGPKEEQIDSESPPTEQVRTIVQSSEDDLSLPSEDEIGLSLPSEDEAGLSPASEAEDGEDEVDVSVEKLCIEQELDNPSEQEEVTPENAEEEEEEEEAESVDKAPAAPVEVPDDVKPEVNLSSLQQEEVVQDDREDEVHLPAEAAEDMTDEQELNLTAEGKTTSEDGEAAADSSLAVETYNKGDSSEQVDSALELPSTANPDGTSPMVEGDPAEIVQDERYLGSAVPPTDDPIEAVQDGENLGSELPRTENPVEVVHEDWDSALPPRQLESTDDGDIDDVIESSVVSEDPIEILPIEQELDNGDAVVEGPMESLTSTDNGDGDEGSSEGVPAEPELDSESKDGIESARELEASDSVLVENGLVSKATIAEEDGQQTLSTPEAPAHDITEVNQADIYASKRKEGAALPEETVEVVSTRDEGVTPQVDGRKPTDDPLPTSTAELSVQEKGVSSHGEGDSEENLMGIDSSNGTAEASIEPAATAFAAVPKERSMEGVLAFHNESTREASLPLIVPVQKDVNQRALDHVNQNGAKRPNGGATLVRRTKWSGCCGMFDLLLHKD